MSTFNYIGGGEYEEVTPLLRWAPLSAMQAHRKKLQQAWRIYVKDDGGRTMGSHMEWRDVPDSNG